MKKGNNERNQNSPKYINRSRTFCAPKLICNFVPQLRPKTFLEIPSPMCLYSLSEYPIDKLNPYEKQKCYSDDEENKGKKYNDNIHPVYSTHTSKSSNNVEKKKSNSNIELFQVMLQKDCGIKNKSNFYIYNDDDENNLGNKMKILANLNLLKESDNINSENEETTPKSRKSILSHMEKRKNSRIEVENILIE